MDPDQVIPVRIRITSCTGIHRYGGTYGHIVGGVDADRGHVGAGAGADVGDTIL